MKKVVAFGASSSSQSINKRLAHWAASQLTGVQVIVLDLNDFEMPMFNVDRERVHGIPDLAHAFKKHIRQADALIISFAEHNGSYSTAFKNIADWISRIEKGIWANKPTLLLATSPGARGAKSVLTTAVNTFPHQGAEVVGSFSLPSFKENFSTEKGITSAELRTAFESELKKMQEKLV